MSTLYKTNGEVKEVFPANGKSFTLEEMQGFVGGLVELVPLPSGAELMVNEEGKLEEYPVVNEKATAIWKKEYPIAEFPHNNDETICGDCVIMSADE